MSWKKVKIGELLTRIKIPINIENDLYYKRVTIKINHNGILPRDIVIGKEIGTKKQFIVKKGQFLVSKIDARYGAFGIVPEELDNAIITGNFWSYSFDQGLLDIKWFNLLIKSESFYDICERSSSGITHRKYLDEKKFLNFEIFLPPLEKQNQIAEKLKHSEAKQKTLKNQINNQKTCLKNLRKQILQDAIEGKLTKEWREKNPDIEPASELLKKIKREKEKLIAEKKIKKDKPLPPIEKNEIPFELPKSWVWTRLGDVCTKITDGFHNTPPKVQNGFPYIAATHVKSDKIDWKNCHYVQEVYHRELFNKTFPKKGEVLVVNIGAGCGTPAIIDVDFEFSFKNTAILKFDQKFVINKLLYYYFLSQKEDIYTELTKGGLQPFLSLKILNRITFPLPSVEEQLAIASKLQILMQKLDEAEKQIEKGLETSKLLTKAILAEAFNGHE